MAEKHSFFHWDLEFPDIFHNDDGKRKKNPGFDAVVGNPPYIEVKKIDACLKPLLKEQFSYKNKSIMKGRFDLFWAFMKRGISLLAKKGFFGFLTEDSILDSASASTLREFLFNETTILGIAYTGKFPNAGVHTVITLLMNNPSDYEFIFENWDTSKKITVNKQFILKQHNHIVNLNLTYNDKRSLESDKIINMIEKKSVDLESIIYCQQGMILQHGSGKNVKKKKEDYVFNNKKQNFLPYIEGKDIDRYFLPSKHRWLDYQPKEHHRPRIKEVFEHTKLLVRRITNKSLVGLIDYGYFFTDNTLFTGTKWKDLQKIRHKYGIQITKAETRLSNTFQQLCVTSSKFEYEYLLAIINSRLMTFYYEKKFHTKSIGVLAKCKIKETAKENQEIVGKITVIIQTLYSNDQEKTYLDYQVLDALIYEIYLMEFLNTDLFKKIKPYVKDFSITRTKTPELTKCKEICKKIKDDIDIYGEIKKIKNNNEIKTIENDTANFVKP